MTRALLLSSLLFVVAACGDDSAIADAGADAASESDAGPPPECTFNADCAVDRRCECDEVEGCFCQPGARGTGVNGVDPCVDGNDCASALCVEGPGTSDVFYCSDACVTNDDCGPMLPQCAEITFLGRVCIRAPTDG